MGNLSKTRVLGTELLHVLGSGGQLALQVGGGRLELGLPRGFPDELVVELSRLALVLTDRARQGRVSLLQVGNFLRKVVDPVGGRE